MNYTLVQKHIDYGRGKEGFILGPPCSIYRNGYGVGAVNFLDAANLYQSNVRILYTPTSKKEDLETPEHMGTIFFDTKVDMTRRQLLLGDVAVVNDAVYGVGSTIIEGSTFEFSCMALCSHMPMKTVISARLDRFAWIYRPGLVDATGYWDERPDASSVLTLSSGVFAFSAVSSTPTAVPIGLTTHSRVFGKAFKDVPGSTGFNHYFCYIPPLPGVHLREGDWIVTDGPSLATGTRYAVIGPWTQEEAVVGYQLILERETSRST